MRFLCAALGVAFLLATPLPAGDDGLTGYWKFSIYESGQPIPFWLLHLQSKNGKLSAETESLKAPKAKIEEIKQVGDTFTFRLLISQGGQAIRFDYEGKLPKPGAKKILGSLSQGASVVPAILEATSAKNAFEVERETLLRTPSDPKALSAVIELIEMAKDHKVDAKELQGWVDGSLKTAERYGPRYQLRQQKRLLDALHAQKAYAGVALETARKVSKEIDPKAPLDAQLQILTSVTEILNAGKAKDEAKMLATRIDKLEGQAYAVYSKESLNYKPVKYAGRKSTSDRAVLLELFTGATCPPCVAADMAFDGVEKTYGPGEAVLLQYHLHVPRPEPMSNADADARAAYYRVEGTPTNLLNGRPGVSAIGPSDNAPGSYKKFCGAIDKLLDSPATFKLSATATRKSDKITIAAKVSDLAKPGEKVRLRIALVEDWVRFKGSNGMQYHHRVVRAFAGGVKGTAVKTKDYDQAASIDLDELRKSLNKYLDEDYRDGPRPLRLRHLHIVAFVQDDATTEVLQAIDVPVKTE